jgi:hypothetical protein
MSRIKLVVCLALAGLMPFTLTGCVAGQFQAGAHAEADLGVFKAGVSVGYNSAGEKVFYLGNPTDTDSWVQPVDSNGNPIGDPIPLPAGGIVELPPGTDMKKTHLVKKPKAKPPKPKPVAPHSPAPASLVTVEPAPVTWSGATTSFGDNGSSSTAEYSVAARSFQEVFAALDLLDQGSSVPNAELVCRTALSPLNLTSAQLNVVLPSSDISKFEVYVNGVLVASSETGLGGGTVIYSTDGFGYGSATIPFSITTITNTVQVITTDNLGVPTSRSISYGL